MSPIARIIECRCSMERGDTKHSGTIFIGHARFACIPAVITAFTLERSARHADFKQELAVERALADGVIPVVGAIDRLIRPDMQPMGTHKEIMTPSAEHIAMSIQDDDRIIAAREQVDIVAPIDRYGGDVAQLHLARDFGPVVARLVSQFAVCEDHARAPSARRA